MKLPVIESDSEGETWYEEGLQFTCSQCGNCCSGAPGFVWISDEEVLKLAEFLHVSKAKVIERYCRTVSGRLSLKENRNPGHGGYDCIFLKEIPAKVTADAGAVAHSTRGCSIYPVRPLQCRTWPFWRENISSPKAWDLTKRKCPGMDTGKLYPRKKIESLRDAKEWPKSPPTSGKP
jgi:Fe-S-cluster containining protein